MELLGRYSDNLDRETVKKVALSILNTALNHRIVISNKESNSVHVAVSNGLTTELNPDETEEEKKCTGAMCPLGDAKLSEEPLKGEHSALSLWADFIEFSERSNRT